MAEPSSQQPAAGTLATCARCGLPLAGLPTTAVCDQELKGADVHRRCPPTPENP